MTGNPAEPHEKVEVKETRKCIKGVDYEERFTINQYSLLKSIGEGSFASVKLC